MKIRWYEKVAYIVLVLSAINWGLTAFDLNLIEKAGLMFFPAYTVTFAYFKTIIYAIIGLVGIYGIYLGIKLNKQ